MATSIARWLGVAALVTAAVTGPPVTPADPKPPRREMEKLGRGVVAVRQDDGNGFLSWRLLATRRMSLSMFTERPVPLMR